jgi:DNA-binding PadR family transcriptional regulator
MGKIYTNQSIYAILGFLNECEMSGYDIRKQAEQTAGYFWHESEGHLYPTLQRMKRAGLIEQVGTGAGSARKRKQYCITLLGKEKLEEWLAEPVQEGRVRNPLLLKLFFSKKVKPKVIREHLERELFKRKEQMAIYKRIQDDINNTDKQQNTQLWEMTLDYGLRMTQCWIDWLQDSLQRIVIK